MKEGWEVKKLTDVCHIQYGYAFDSSCFCDDDSYPQLIRIRDVVRGYSETFYNGNIPEGYFVYKGDYLIGMDGEFHIAPWQSEKALLNQRVCKISASDCDVDERFIYYTMSVVLKQIEDETPFVTVKHLSAKRLNLVKIPIPPLPEQSRIVEELDQLSNIIEKKRQQLSELDNLAQSIFYDMFGDPVTNEKGWEVKKLGEFANVKIGPFGSLLHNSDYIIGGTPLVNPIHMKNEQIFPENNFTVSEEKLKDLGAYLLQTDDIIMARRGDIGRCALVRKADNGYVCGTGSLFIRLSQLCTPLFLIKTIRTLSMIDYLTSKAKGATMLNINCKIVEDLPIPLPPLQLQQLFAQKIEAIEKEKELIKQSIKETEELFNSRMDYYFS